MKRTTKLLTLLLALAMVFALIPAVARAEEAPVETETVTVEIPFRVNPLYEGMITEDDLDIPEFPERDPNEVEPNAGYYYSIDQAGAMIRSYMKARYETFTIDVWADSSDGQLVGDQMFEIALSHTGVATEGDYLRWQYGGWEAEATRSYNEIYKRYEYTYKFVVPYYTTAEQEWEMSNAVSNLISSLGLWNKTDHGKISALYDWICQNVTYDYENLEDTTYTRKHTAYAALIDKTAVCQGYALLFYRVMLEVGVDNRLIAGLAASGEAHGWNIVKLGNYYYSVDSTWDAGVEEYSFFLTNTWNFLGHYRFLEYETWEFHEKYPMAAENYDPNTTAEMDPYIYVGLDTEEIAWILYRNGTLEMIGTGNMSDYRTTENAPWLFWADGVKTLTVGEGITGIGWECFENMPNLTSVSLPSTLTIIKDNAFLNDTALKEIVFPEGLKTIGSDAFRNCDALTKVIIPESVANVQGFQGCDNLTTVEIYGYGRIGMYAFASCKSLVNLVIGENITSISGAAFQYCDSLKVVTIPSTVSSVDGFSGCKGLEEVYLHNSGPIENYAFDGDTNLRIIEITNATSIGHMAFYNAAVETITIPATVKKMEYACLGSCDQLTEIIFEGDAPAFNYQTFVDTTATAYYPANNPTWTADVMQDYGGTITWVPMEADCTEHEYTSVITDPTCEEQGYTTYICIHCGVRYLDDYVDALGHDLVSSITEPTCYREGWTMHQCTRCDYAYSDSHVDMVDHSYEDGHCKWCGKSEKYVSFSTISTSLGGNIAMNFYVELSKDLVADPDAYIRFTFADKTIQVPLSEGKESVKNGVTIYQFSCPITSKNMTDEITAQVYNASGAVGPAKTMSVDTYCNWVIQNFTDEKTVNLMKAMLNYGASAQMLFNYRTDDLANAALAAEDKIFGAVDASAYIHSRTGEEEGIKPVSYTLLLDSETTIRCYFELTGDKSIEEFTFTVDGVEVQPQYRDGRWYIEKTNIAAHRLDDMHVFTCGNITITYGGLSYVNQVMTYYESGTTFDMASALYAYSKAAEAYIG